MAFLVTDITGIFAVGAFVSGFQIICRKTVLHKKLCPSLGKLMKLFLQRRQSTFISGKQLACLLYAVIGNRIIQGFYFRNGLIYPFKMKIQAVSAAYLFLFIDTHQRIILRIG